MSRLKLYGAPCGSRDHLYMHRRPVAGPQGLTLRAGLYLQRDRLVHSCHPHNRPPSQVGQNPSHGVGGHFSLADACWGLGRGSHQVGAQLSSHGQGLLYRLHVPQRLQLQQILS